MPTPVTEIGVSLKLIEKAPVDAKNVVETLAEAQAMAFEGYNPYIKQLQGFYVFKNSGREEFTMETGVTREAVLSLIANLVDSSPATLDTLKELATAVNNDPNFGAGMISNISTINTQITQILGVIAVAPTYFAPTASITSVSQTIEKGTNLALTLNIGFAKNDAGNATGYTLLRNGVLLSNLQANSQPETNVQTAITFQGQVSYSEGIANKLNNLGIEDPTGHILAGTVNSSVQTITPRLKSFYGSVVSNPTNSAEGRALTWSGWETTATFDLITGIVNKKFAVLIPATRSILSVTDITNLGANMTNSYILIDAAFIVNDAGGNPQTYKLYVCTNSVPYSTSATHRIVTI